MFRGSVSLLIGTGLFLSTEALAQMEKPPASQPTTRIAADTSTPQGAYILLMRATQSGNSAAARDLLHASTPDEAKLADLLAQSVEQNQKFKVAVAKQFGDTAADAFAGSAADAAEVEKEISKSKAKIDTSNATLATAEGMEMVKLIQIEGKWKVSVAGLADGNAAQMQQGIGILLHVLLEVTDELGQGKYKTEAELQDALRSKRAAAIMLAAQSATSQPATAPAKP